MARPLPLTAEPGALPRCGRCGDPVGVYEPLRWRHPDGSVQSCGWLEARSDPECADPRSRFFHRDCAPGPDQRH